MLKTCLTFFLSIPLLLGAAQGNPFVAFTVPKSGTFLCAKFLHILSGAKGVFVADNAKDIFNQYYHRFKNGTFCYMHFKDQFHLKNYRAIFQNVVPIVGIRDPRDVCVSTVYYFKLLLDQMVGPSASFNDRLSFVINYTGTGQLSQNFSPFYFFVQAIHIMETLNPLVIRFEHLVGPKGGGTLSHQLYQIYQIAQGLNIPMDDAKGLRIGNQLFGGTMTFREGQIGSWRKEFTQEHIAQFKASALEPILIRLGYEADDNW